MALTLVFLAVQKPKFTPPLLPENSDMELYLGGKHHQNF